MRKSFLSSSKSVIRENIEKCKKDLSAYKRELGVSAQNFLDDAIRKLPENIRVVSWKVMDAEKFFSSSSPDKFEANEIKNLDDKEIFTQLILSKSGLDGESEEGKAVLDKFLPLFLQI